MAVFTGGMTGTMKCFIAGTLIATETGFAGIESIKPGDVVLSTNADTMETGYKKVLEKYVRKTRELVHIIAGGEEIVSTPDHPYYVAGRGFVNACQLCIGSPLLDADGRVFETEQIYKEYLEEDEEVTVYNFQVEDWHTYHVGKMEVLVHNAEYGSGSKAIDYVKLSDELGNKIEMDGYKIIDIEDAATANADWADMGYDLPPVAAGTKAYNVEAGNYQYARVFKEGVNKPKSPFILRADDIEGLSASEIAEKYALPQVPDKIVYPQIPSETPLEVSTVGPQEEWGTLGGDAQYAIKDVLLDDDWFTDIHDLK